MSILGMAAHIKTIIASLLHHRQMIVLTLCGRTKINGPLRGGWLTPF